MQIGGDDMSMLGDDGTKQPHGLAISSLLMG